MFCEIDSTVCLTMGGAESDNCSDTGRNPGDHVHFRGGEERCEEEQRERSVKWKEGARCQFR